MSDSSLGEDYEPYIIGSRLSVDNEMTQNFAENPKYSELPKVRSQTPRKKGLESKVYSIMIMQTFVVCNNTA